MPSLSAFVLALCSATFCAATLAQDPPAPSPQQGTCDAACQDAKKAADAANAAAAAAKNAADNANSAAGTANSATRDANSAANSADNAANQAREATQDAAKAAAKAKSEIDALKKAAANRAAVRRGRAKKPTIDDFVPCVFDDPQTYELRTLADPYNTPLNPAAANLVANSAQRTATALGSATPIVPTDDKAASAQSRWKENIKNFATDLKADQFVGVLPKDIPGVVRALASQNGVSESADLVSKSAENALSSAFDRPDDVSCSFSLLQWKETSDNFGRRVANDYIGLQVNVRNLNTKTEFLIHDIQVAVDTGLSPVQFGRFQTARDKLIVRGVAQKGQSEDARNRIINLLVLLGAIAGPASAALTQGNPGSDAAANVSTAVSIFQTPFMAGLTAMFPDHTVAHLNHINDLAFSASSSSKTVVPIQGSVPLVTFLAEKPIEQLPFAYCGVNGHGKFLSHNSEDPDSPGSSQYNYCNFEEQASATDQPDYYMKPLHFHYWRPAAIEILQRRVFVVIAGVHILEVPNTARVDRVSCPPANDENVDLTKADSSGAVTCTLHGSNLTKASAIKLEQQGAKTISGTLTATDDQTATITFKTADAAGATGKYELFLTDTSGTDVDAKQGLNFGNPTTITKISCQPGTDANLDLSKADTSTAISCALTGTNLDKASYFKLDQPNAQTIWPSVKAAPDGNSTTMTFTLDDNLKKATGSYELWFTDATGKSVDSGQKITLTTKPST